MSRASRIVKNTLSKYLRTVVSVVFFLFLTPYIAQKLGTEIFGLWSLLWSIVGLLALFDLGFSPAVVKFIGEARGREEPKRIRKLTATFFWVHLTMGTIAMVTACFIAPFLGTLLQLSPELTRPGQIVFLILSFRIAQSLPFGLFSSLLVAYQKETYANYFKMVSTLIYGAAIYFSFESGASIYKIALANLGSALLVNIVLLIVAKVKLPDVYIGAKHFDRGLVKEIGSFSVFAVILFISKLLYTRVDAIIIKLMLSLKKVAYYNIAVQTVERASSITDILQGILSPIIAESKGRGDNAALRKILLDGSRLSFALAAPLLVGFLWLTRPLIIAWMGEEFIESVLPMQILIGAKLISTLLSGSQNILMLTGHHKVVTSITVASQFVNLVLTLIFAKLWGLPGVAIATFLSVSLSYGTLTVMACVKHHVHIIDFFKSVLLPSLLPTLFMLAVLGTIEYVYAPNNLFFVALYELVACIVFFSLFYVFGLPKEMKTLVQTKLFKRKKKLP